MILGTLARGLRALSLSDEKAWNPSLWNLAGARSLSGETVTEETALTFSAVYNAIVLIAGTIGALPLHLLQKQGKTRRIAGTHKAHRVLSEEWNPWMTAMAGRECLMAHVLAWGNGYAEKVRDGAGNVVELWPITPNRVRPVRLQSGGIAYLVKMPDGDMPVPRDDMLHVPGLGFDGFLGYSTVAMARKSIGLGMAIESFGSLYFGQGTHPGVVVSHPGKLSDTGHKNLEGSLVTQYSGLGQSHRLMLLDEGMKIENVGIPPEDSQFLESRQFHVSEIARWFNLPPHKLKDLSRSSFSNIESEQRSFYVDAILPWLIRLEQNFNQQLLSKGDRGQYGRGQLYFKHNVEGLLRGDVTARGAFYAAMLDRGVFNINEVRELEDRDPVEGGDVHLVPLNMTTLENAGKPPEPPPAPVEEGALEEEDADA